MSGNDCDFGGSTSLGQAYAHWLSTLTRDEYRAHLEEHAATREAAEQVAPAAEDAPVTPAFGR